MKIPDFEVISASFGSHADIGACVELGDIHRELVNTLLDLLETRLAVTLALFADSI